MSAWLNIFYEMLTTEQKFQQFRKTFNFSGNLELFASVADFDAAIVFSYRI